MHAITKRSKWIMRYANVRTKIISARGTASARANTVLSCAYITFKTTRDRFCCGNEIEMACGKHIFAVLLFFTGACGSPLRLDYIRGWNSWNSFTQWVDEEKLLAQGTYLLSLLFCPISTLSQPCSNENNMYTKPMFSSQVECASSTGLMS